MNDFVLCMCYTHVSYSLICLAPLSNYKNKVKDILCKVKETMSSALFNNDTLNFKVEEEHTNTTVGVKPPECILSLKAPNPERATLSDKELGEAKMLLWNNKFLDLKFPRERKFRVDPVIAGQTVGIVSFMPSKNAIPDKDGCFGVLKLRGNFSNQTDAERYGSMLMRKYDSYAEYDLVKVGQEFPLMVDNSIYAAETREINLKAIVDDISLSYIRKKKEEERRERQEVEERSRKLLSKNTSEDQEESLDDLEYYTTLRTKKAHCQHVVDEAQKKKQEAEEALVKICAEIEKLDKQHPTYKVDYIQQYNNAIRSVGAEAKENPLLKYMNADLEAEQKQQ